MTAQELQREKGFIRNGRVLVLVPGPGGQVTVLVQEVPNLNHEELAGEEAATLAHLRAAIPALPSDAAARDRFLHRMKGLARPSDGVFLAFDEVAQRWLYCRGISDEPRSPGMSKRRSVPEAVVDSNPEVARLVEYLAARGLTRADVPNYRPVPSVSRLPGIRLFKAGTGFEIRYSTLAGGYAEGLSRSRITDPHPPLDHRGNPIRFTQATGSGSHLYVPVCMVDPIRTALLSTSMTEPLLVVEGEPKADKAAKHAAGQLVVGIAGIDGWSRGDGRPHDLLARLMRRPSRLRGARRRPPD